MRLTGQYFPSSTIHQALRPQAERVFQEALDSLNRRRVRPVLGGHLGDTGADWAVTHQYCTESSFEDGFTFKTWTDGPVIRNGDDQDFVDLATFGEEAQVVGSLPRPPQHGDVEASWELQDLEGSGLRMRVVCAAVPELGGTVARCDILWG